MGRDSVAAKARRQAAKAAAAGQGAVTEPRVPAIGPGVPEGIYTLSMSEAKADEPSFGRLARSISIFTNNDAFGEQARNVLTASTQLRDAAEKIHNKLKQEERSAPNAARAQEVRDAIQRLSLGTYTFRSAAYRLKQPLAYRINDDRSQTRVRYEVARQLLLARQDLRNAQRALRDANTVAKVDIRALKDGVI